MWRLFLALSLLPLTACSTIAPKGVITRSTRDWRQVATAADRQRLRNWRTVWINALRQAEAGGHGAEVRREGVLLQPDAALGGAGVANGAYRCRLIKLGSRAQGLLPFVAYQPFACRVKQERDLQGFAKLSGSQRQVGLIFPGDQLRQVFLGTLVLGDEARAMQYGVDDARDLAGYVERIGPQRWRLVLPSPRYESLVDVLELVPA
ncbi:DUF4893 domain-containing protein [Sphingomonas sp. BN140010]|uniref:DUF4893 domain-containing protein n=1 Tax=Sphingomonas arvum TaxID=2992113 RepID=A0ABT3JCA8_9SPHN|nr:DUF4893 domain-containing protein [Sphingomonas sp. BN140010]MCW3796710.1 DUF4893 domain-containing protein [Sphingomonas sp. BN140010]